MKSALRKKNVEENVVSAIVYSGFVFAGILLAFWAGTLFHYSSEHGKDFLWASFPALIAEAYGAGAAWLALSLSLGGMDFVRAVGKSRLIAAFCVFTGLLCVSMMGLPGIILALLICGIVFFSDYVSESQ